MEIDIQSGVKAFQAQSHGFYAQASTAARLQCTHSTHSSRSKCDQNFQFSFACIVVRCQHDDDDDDDDNDTFAIETISCFFHYYHYVRLTHRRMGTCGKNALSQLTYRNDVRINN